MFNCLMWANKYTARYKENVIFKKTLSALKEGFYK